MFVFYLFKRLQQKLQNFQGNQPEDIHSLRLPNPHSPHLQQHQVSSATSGNTHQESSTISTSELLSNISKTNTHPVEDKTDTDGVILHSDTIILVSSMVFMIIMGKFDLG